MIYQKILDSGVFTVNYISDSRENITVFCPGLAWSKVAPYFLFSRAAKSLYDKGNNALLFDYYGQGDSEGDYNDVTFDAVYNSLADVMNYLALQGYKCVTLVGMGIGNVLIELFLGSPQVVSAVFIDYDREIYANIAQYSKIFDNESSRDGYIIDEIDDSMKGRVLRAFIGVTPWYRGYPINYSSINIPKIIEGDLLRRGKSICFITKAMLHEWATCLDSLSWERWVECREWPDALDKMIEFITNWIINEST